MHYAQTIRTFTLCVCLLAAGPLGLSGCATATIAMKERLGYAKREQLVDGVQKARDAQEQAKEQFTSALEEFIAVTQVDADELEATYSRLNTAYESSKKRAGKVRDRIASVERVANALFKEWEAELNEYSSETLRASSQQQLDTTRTQYQGLLRAMKKAESTMDPVLEAFADQVLFLKHNLNARAIASLEGTVGELEAEIGVLIRDMEASIAEANAFIDSMGS